MNEEKKSQRPNENYPLSKPDISQEDAEKALKHEKLTFYYNREQRLEKAPQAVRDLYKRNKNYSKFNLFRPLVADKPRAILFFTILMMCAAIFILSIVDKLGTSTYLLDGNRLEITGARYEGTTIIVLKKTVSSRSSRPYTGAVDIAVSPAASSAEEEYPVFFHRVYFSMEPAEEYRFAVPFDDPEQLIAFQAEASSIAVRFNPD